MLERSWRWLKNAQLSHPAGSTGAFAEKEGGAVKVIDWLPDCKKVLFPISDPIQALAALHCFLFLMASHCAFFL